MLLCLPSLQPQHVVIKPTTCRQAVVIRGEDIHQYTDIPEVSLDHYTT